jgi:hypothetical protein
MPESPDAANADASTPDAPATSASESAPAEQQRSGRSGRVRRKKTGRPAFKPTKEQRDKVRRWAAAGFGTGKMSRLIGIDAKTFRKAFGDVVELARPEAEADILDAVAEQAKRGELGHAKYWLAVCGSKRIRERSREKKAGDEGAESAPLTRPVIIKRSADSGAQWNDEVPGEDGADRSGPDESPADEDAGRVRPESEAISLPVRGSRIGENQNRS